MIFEAKDYQKTAIKFLKDNKRSGLALDPGLGKTSSTLSMIVAQRARDYRFKVLLVAPKRVMAKTWPDEVAKWDQFKHLRVAVLHGKDRLKTLLAREHDIYCINPEGLAWLYDHCEEPHYPLFKCCVIDESSKFKSPKLKTKNGNPTRLSYLLELTRGFDRVHILTGTPAPNSLRDLFTQLFILDRGKTWGCDFDMWVSQYYKVQAIPKQAFKKYEIRKGAADKIHREIAPWMLRIDGEEYLDLPERLDNFINVEMSGPARDIYNDMQNELFAMLDDGQQPFAANSEAGAYRACHQIANGALYQMQQPNAKPLPAQKRGWNHVHDAKIEAVVDLVDELCGKPILIAYQYHHDRERLHKVFPHARIIGGGTTLEESDEIINKWNAGKIEVLLAHPASIAHGLNMQTGPCSDVCWFSLTDNLENYLQFNKRVLRQGNKSDHVRVHHIITERTIDEALRELLKRKEHEQGQLLQYLVQYRKRCAKN